VQLPLLEFVSGDDRIAAVIGALDVENGLRLVLGGIFAPEPVDSLISNITAGKE